MDYKVVVEQQITKLQQLDVSTVREACDVASTIKDLMYLIRAFG